MTDMNMRANATAKLPGRTYRFYTGKSIYAFGHGLSYSLFSKFIISAPSTVVIKQMPNNIISSSNAQAIDISTINCKNLQFDVVIGVKNSGPMGGAHVVLVFWKPPNSSVAGTPKMELVGFDRVEVRGGRTKNVTIGLDVCRGLSLADSEGKRKLVLGQHLLIVGSTSERQVRHHLNVRLAGNGTEGGAAYI